MSFVSIDAVIFWVLSNISSFCICIHWEPSQEKLYHHALHRELCVAPEEHSVLLAQSPFTPKREAIMDEGSLVLSGGNTMFPGIQQRLQTISVRERRLVDGYIRWNRYNKENVCVHSVAENDGQFIPLDVSNMINNYTSALACMKSIIAPEDRKYCVWMGGSIMGSLSSMNEQWITKEMYDETGACIIHRRFNVPMFSNH